MTERFVLDTSVFTNPDIYAQFGTDSPNAILGFLELVRQTSVQCFMPRSVYDELRLMKNLGKLPPEFEASVRIRSPRKFTLQIPAQIVYELIEEVRKRIDRGQHIAEEYAKAARETGEIQDPGRVINRLRERYREALRQGIIDSREDMDVLLLAYELDGVLISADEGLRKWADKVGVKILMPENLRSVLETLIEHHLPGQPIAQ
ncbi:RNA ligase partner protein [Methylocaldum szegediense]|uniref:RNA-free ribonuclease P n=1 Tax=Methylocaldum szegediense TaxID=73780 RepID=A0ABN8X9A9_9GAMM|nr:RNA ligase partner protein [Methylocaldum szegediense]CAI8955582.1 RNA-free ribonuclease P [Methylocaldum szegediense]